MGNLCCFQGSKSNSAHQVQYQVEINSQEVIINDEVMITDEPLTCIDSQDAKKLMHKSICAITYFFISNGHTKCCHGSGILISRNIILTAAHNIYLRDHNLEGNPANYKIYLSVSGVGEHFYQVDKWKYSSKFPQCQLNLKAQFDYCIIKLKTKVLQEMFLPISLPCKCILQKKSELVLKVFGFPTNDNYQPIGQSNPKIILNQYGMSKKDAIAQIQLQKYTIKYNIINTLGGQSGCPLIIDDRVIGIHVGSIKVGDKKSNLGRIITENLLNDINKWIKEVQGDPVTIIKKPSCSICIPSSQKKLKQQKNPFKETQPIVNWKIKEEGDYINPTDSNQEKKYLPKIPLSIGQGQQQKQMTIGEQLKQMQRMMEKGLYKFIKEQYEDSANSYRQSIQFYKQHCAKDSKELRTKYVRSISKLGQCYIMMKRYKDGLQHFIQLKNKSSSSQKSIQDWLGIFQERVSN